MGGTTPTTPQGRRIRGLDADQRRAQRRDSLLTAAFDLFAREGYANTSIEQICQTAYVGNKAFYELFDSKEDCYLALMNEIGERIERQVEDELRRTSPDEEEEATVRRVVAAFAHALVDDPRVAVVAFRESAGISPRVEAQRRENRRWAAGVLETFWCSKAAAGDTFDYRALAVATVGGLFEIIAEFLSETDPARTMEGLTRDLTLFVLTVGNGIHSPRRVD